MPILVFTTNFDKLRDGSKRQTIRKNWKYWWNAHEKGQKLHVWLGSPRQPGTAEKLGISEQWSIGACPGELLTAEDAQRDGYDSLEDLFHVLSRMHHMNWNQILKHRWAIIRFVLPGDAGFVRDLNQAGQRS